MGSERLLVLSAIAIFAAQVQVWGEDMRIGWEEDFTGASVAHWKAALEKPKNGTPPAKAEAADGCINIVTCRGDLDEPVVVGISKTKEWPEWKDTTGFTNFEVQYDTVVDFDVYKYLVIRIVEKGTFAVMLVNGKETKVCYTTGIHAQDLGALGLRGKQKPLIYFNCLNSSGNLKIKYIRFVKELTAEEKAGLIDEGSILRAEGRPAHPYHELEALNARAGRPLKKERVGGEWCVYRDTGTGAEVWRMTNRPTNEYGVAFNCDGSAFTVKGRGEAGFHVWDWPSRSFKLVTGGLSDASPRFATTEPASIIMAENQWLERPKRKLSVHRFNFRTGEKTEIASFETDAPWRVQELASSPFSSKMLFGFRETPTVFMIDPEADAAHRATPLTLPTRLKAVRLANNDTEVCWYNCYTYEGRWMNLKTREEGILNSPCAGGHAAGGLNFTIGPYGEALKLKVPNDMHIQSEAEADAIRIFANYRENVEVDYGNVSPNGKWMVTDGVRGDLEGKHLMFSIDDPAAVLQVCNHHTSRNDWVTNTYSAASPDATKVAWISDQFDDGDVYMAITGRPAPPTELKAVRNDAGVQLSWHAPKGAREVAGYRVYRSLKGGTGFIPFNREPMKATEFLDENAPKDSTFYVVATCEPSGLEGNFSNEASVGTKLSLYHYYQSENAKWAAPARIAFHGDASSGRYLRIHHASATEPKAGHIRFSVSGIGGFTLWLRGRAEGEAGEWTCKVGDRKESVGYGKKDTFPTPPPDDREKPVDAVSGAKGSSQKVFHWKSCRGQPFALKENTPLEIDISGSVDGLALDQIALALIDIQGIAIPPGPKAPGPDTEPPDDVSALESFDVTPQSLKLRWKPSPSLNIQRYDIHQIGADPVELGNQTIIGSTAGTEFEDWGLRPGTAYTYAVIPVDTRGNKTIGQTIQVTTAAQTVQTIAEDVEKAACDPRTKAVKSESGIALVTLPKVDGDAAKADYAKVTYTVDVKEQAPFMFWLQYRPAYVAGKDMILGVEIDGAPAVNFSLRHPYAPMAFNQWDAGKRPERVWTDKLVLNGKDVFDLASGPHTITFLLDPKLTELQHALGKFTICNDHSFRPEGYNPRANFLKRWW